MPPKRSFLVNKLVRLPGVGSYLRSAHDLWIRSTYDRNWDTKNKPARHAFEKERPALNEEQAQVLVDLQRRGVGHVHFDQLFGDQRPWQDLEAMVQAWCQSREVIEKERAYKEKDYQSAAWKEYIIRYYGNDAAVPWQSPLLQLGLESEILGIVNSYLGLMTKMISVDVWNTIPVVHDRKVTGSQRWHRDPEDRKLVKVFLYFSEVDATSGPLHYVPKSRKGEQYGQFWPQRMPYGSIPPAEEVEGAIPRSEWEVCTHPAGTLLFVDTSGLHMGGRATHRNRLFATWTFVSHASLWPRRFSIEDKPASQALPTAVRYALG